MVLLLGHLEDGRGQWEREGSSAGLWNECVLEKTTHGAKAVCLCRILDPDVFSGLRRFFRNPAEFCRIEVRHVFPPKGASRYNLDLFF